MGVVVRGTRNAFRNTIRTVSITLILALSIAMAMVMLLSLRAVESRIADVKANVGTTITVSAAGQRGFQGGGTPLTAADLKKVARVAHVATVTPTLEDQWTSASASAQGGGGFRFGGASSGLTTSLTGVQPPQNAQPGGTNASGGASSGRGGGDFVLPIRATGTTAPTSTRVAGTNALRIVDGTTIDGTGADMVALVGKDLADANDLAVGSTFTVGDHTITVAGITSTGNTFADSGVIMPLAALQSLTGRTGEVTRALVTVDSVDHLDATTTALQQRLGSAADVVSDATGTQDAIASLDNVRSIALYSLVGALVAGSVIIFLSMLMIVRERRREIGVLKAIGSSNTRVSLQFVTEAATLTLMAAVIGVLAGLVLSNPVLDVMVSSSDQTAATASPFPNRGNGGPAASANGSTGQAPAPPNGGRISFAPGITRGFTRFGDALANVNTVVGADVLVYGLLVALLIAVVGSSVPAWLTAKVRPAEVMRVE